MFSYSFSDGKSTLFTFPKDEVNREGIKAGQTISIEKKSKRNGILKYLVEIDTNSIEEVKEA